jgi:trehalose-phosphatase
MMIPRAIEQFWHVLAAAPERVLMLDYDGTLAPFTTERDKAYPYPGVRDAVADIIAQGRTRLAVITGRGIDEIPHLLGLGSGYETWGSHGLERRHADGTTIPVELPAVVKENLKAAEETARRVETGSQLELKPGCVALHWRGLSAAAAMNLRDLALTEWAALTATPGLELREFDGGVELRATLKTKGDAVGTILAEVGPGAAAAYLGDDTTDEDAFRVLKGRGLPVLVRKEERPTLAAAWIRPPEELLSFFGQWLKHCS